MESCYWLHTGKESGNIEKLLQRIAEALESINNRFAEHMPTHAESEEMGKEFAEMLLKTRQSNIGNE